MSATRRPRPRSPILAALIGALVLGAKVSAAPVTDPGGGRCPSLERSGLTVEHHYTLNARVRPTLFWIGRDDVGSAWIARTMATDGAVRLQLLIGSDPDRAPMRLNRWGYVSESVCDTRAELVGVMTESEEQSAEEVQARIARAPGGSHIFKAIRSDVVQGESRASVVRVAFATALTYRDVDTVLQQLPPGSQAPRLLRMPEGTKPGFLVAVADLLRETADALLGSSRAVPRPVLSRTYIYNGWLYDLRVQDSTLLPQARVGTRTYQRVVETAFETRNRATGSTTKFRVTCGTLAPLTGVPIRIVYRPKWWFEAELLLREDDAR